MDSMPSALSAISAQSTDTEIFLAIRSQQVKAVDLLYDRYGKLVYSIAFRMLNNVEEAEEITQETFLRLWQRSEIYQPDRGSLSGFLIMLTRSRCLDLLRFSFGEAAPSRKATHQKLQRIQTASECVPSYNPPLEFVTVKERSHLVREALKQLSPIERELLETAYYHGLSQSEIAKRDGIPLGTVKWRFSLGEAAPSRQALKKLRAALKHHI